MVGVWVCACVAGSVLLVDGLGWGGGGLTTSGFLGIRLVRACLRIYGSLVLAPPAARREGNTLGPARSDKGWPKGAGVLMGVVVEKRVNSAIFHCAIHRGEPSSAPPSPQFTPDQARHQSAFGHAYRARQRRLSLAWARVTDVGALFGCGGEGGRLGGQRGEGEGRARRAAKGGGRSTSNGALRCSLHSPKQ